MSALAPELFYPSNCDHGIAFESMFCRRCAGHFGGHCRILMNAMCNGEHPKWVRADNRLGGECLSFKPKGEHKAVRKLPNARGRQGELL